MSCRAQWVSHCVDYPSQQHDTRCPDGDAQGQHHTVCCFACFAFFLGLHIGISYGVTGSETQGTNEGARDDVSGYSAQSENQGDHSGAPILRGVWLCCTACVTDCAYMRVRCLTLPENGVFVVAVFVFHACHKSASGLLTLPPGYNCFLCVCHAALSFVGCSRAFSISDRHAVCQPP